MNAIKRDLSRYLHGRTFRTAITVGSTPITVKISLEYSSGIYIHSTTFSSGSRERARMWMAILSFRLAEKGGEQNLKISSQTIDSNKSKRNPDFYM